MPVVRSISAGSRPDRRRSGGGGPPPCAAPSRCRRRRCSCRAYFATSLSVTCSPPPPMQDRQVRLDGRRDVARRPARGSAGRVAVGSLAVEHPAHDRQRLAQPAQPLREAVAELEPERLVLLLEPRPADPEDRPPAARCGRASSPSSPSAPARGTCSRRPSARSGSASSPGPRPRASASPRRSARRCSPTIG